MNTRSGKRDVLGLVGWLLLTYAASAIGAVASVDAGTFYAELQQPTWAPPAWLFGPVWTLLYTLMAVAAWMVWRQGAAGDHRSALGLFVVQLLLNGLWSWLFFSWRLGGVAFAEILILWGFIVAVLVAFWKVRPLAGVLLVPYLLWVSFAALLNFTLWRQNPQLL